MKISYTFRPAPDIYVSDLEYHEQGDHAGYITACTTFHGKYVRETVFRVHDHRNEQSVCLVRIDQSHLHPAAGRHWREIEQGFIHICRHLQITPGMGTKALNDVKNETGGM